MRKKQVCWKTQERGGGGKPVAARSKAAGAVSVALAQQMDSKGSGEEGDP